MILPAIGIAIYNRFDLLLRCLESIDCDVGLLVIVNNGPETLQQTFCLPTPHIRERIVLEPRQNLGVAGAWNHIQDCVFNNAHRLGSTPLDGVMICGNDIEWQPGDLALVAKAVADFPEADFVFGNHSYSNFLVKRSGWEKIGAFDENIEKAYLEDSDHWQRIRHTPGVKAIHAPGLRALHEGSATIKSDPEYRKLSAVQHDLNWQYYGRKWGCEPHSHASERFVTPFNNGGPVNEWELKGPRLQRPFYFSHNPEVRS